MRSNWLLLSSVVFAFSNTSPVVIVSNSHPLPDSVSINGNSASEQQVYEQVSAVISDASSNCNFDNYVFVNAPDFTESQFTPELMPFLTHEVRNAADSFTSAGSLGSVTKDELNKLMQGLAISCNASKNRITPGTLDIMSSIAKKGLKSPRVFSLEFDNHPNPNDVDPQSVDNAIGQVVGKLPSGNYLLICVSTKSESSKKQRSVDTEYESLFKNYQFFSPALFMGLIVSGLLLVVFLIALKAVQSMQISTAAFQPSTDTRKSQ